MKQTILNREFKHPADGWYQIEAKGAHPNRAAGIIQVIDDEAVNAIVNRFNGDAKAGKLRHGHEMLIDHEHFADQADKETRAYGWLQELQNREDGIYARIRWTATGQTAVDGGDYRFFSTEYVPADLKVLNATKPRRVRPLRLDGLSLTNMNNNRGQRPITNRIDFAELSDLADSKTTTNKQKAKSMKSVCALLGLSAEADETSVHAEVTKLKNRISTIEPFETENKTLKERLAQMEGEQVDGLLDLHGVKEEKVRNRIRPMLVVLKNREERVTALLDLGHKPADPKGGKSVRILNRGEGREKDSAVTPTEVTPAQLQNEVRKVMNRDGIKDFSVGYNTLLAERPELFTRPEPASK